MGNHFSVCKKCKTGDSSSEKYELHKVPGTEAPGEGNESTFPSNDEDDDSNESDSGFKPSSLRHGSTQRRQKPISPEATYKVSVAIDFGTTFTGYACSYHDHKDSVIMNPNWPNHAGGSTAKAPTCALYDGNEKFLAFGYDAQNRYRDKEPGERMYLYEKFKMKLIRTGTDNLSLKTQIESDCGHKMSAIKVFADVLKFLKDKYLEKAEFNEYNIKLEDVLWVLTVPAIWNDGQKFFMRQAALEAGLVDDILSMKLVIALEPEAASLYGRSLPGPYSQLGKKYIILDAGGGTVDVTVHEVQPDGKCNEICAPSGGPFGGNNVNSEFEKYLAKIFGNDMVNKFKKHSSNFHTLIDYFEIQKINWSPGEEITLTATMGLAIEIQEQSGRDLDSIIEENKGKGIYTTGNKKLKIGSKIVEGFFKKWIGLTVDHMTNLISTEELSGVPVLMVGGFSESKSLKQAIQSVFGKDNVIIPENPSQAVLKGAAMFGHKQDFIQSRKSPCTYYILGLDSMKDINQKINPKRHVGGGQVEILKPVVYKHEDVKLNKEIIEYGNPAEDHMTQVYLTLYSSSEDDIVDDPYDARVTKITTVEVPVPKYLKDKLITITFVFGGTDIKVTAQNASGKSVEGRLTFAN